MAASKENQRIQELLRAWSSRGISAPEEQELADWIIEHGGQSAVHAHVKELVDEYKPGELLLAVHWDSLFERIQELKKHRPVMLPETPVRRIRTWKRWIAAASILLLIGAGSYFFLYNRKAARQEIAGDLPNDVEAPKTSRATIRLADGRIIALDSLSFLDQANVRLERSADGKLIYSGTSSEVIYNTLINPRGSKVIDMTLADGSRVWLNAGSSVTYPVAFVGNERKLTLTGEGYFEVSRDPNKKFIVDANGTTTEVLGTHFNVNAYDDEEEIKVTLLEGSVKVNKTIIRPGEQAKVALNRLTNRNDKVIVTQVDVEEVLAWKNGLFKFDNTDIKTLMRQISRWYDVEIVYEGKVPNEAFMGGVSRQENVSALLKVLEATNKVNFRIEGKKVIVL